MIRKPFLCLLALALVFAGCSKKQNPAAPPPAQSDAPGTPQPTAPYNGIFNLTGSVVMAWNAGSGATGHTLQVATDNAFATLVISRSGLTATSYSADSLMPGTQYYWRVRADNANGSSGWSSIWRFSMRGWRRILVAEEFTATWCTYCPAAATGLEDLDAVAGDSLIVLAYHSSNSGDPFYLAASGTRATYYAMTGYPTVYFAGGDEIVGGASTGSMYNSYRTKYDYLKLRTSPLEMAMTFTAYDSTARNATVRIAVRNGSGATQSGRLLFAVTERNISYSWQTLSKLDFVVRSMLPDGSGESISIAAGDSLAVSRVVSIGPSWAAANCRYIAFVQGTDKTVLQGAMLAPP
jgi:thiol-disulfide isomerase/thioredoxin